MSLFHKIMNKLGRYRLIKDRISGDDYMHRYYLFLKDRKWFPFNLTLHKIVKSDEPVMHDHPWAYMTIILKGGYWEHTPVFNLDRMVCELSRYMTEWEIDQCVAVLNTLATSEFDINLTVDDAALQLKIILGDERYQEVKQQWSLNNQHLIPDGRVKYYRAQDNTWWDGLDDSDDPKDYQRVVL